MANSLQTSGLNQLKGVLANETMKKNFENILKESAAPVVRCKNCMYWNITGEGIGECKRLEVADSDPEITHAFQTTHDWFCADGEWADEPTCGPGYCEIGGGDGD